jgi:Fic family protein
MIPNARNVLFLLRESNSIEREYDSLALLDAFYAWDFMEQIEIKDLDFNTLKQLHFLLMQNRDTIPDNQKGVVRNFPITVGGQTKSLPKIVIESQLLDWIEDNKNPEIDPLTLHIRYENIHPWADGNGRTGRILLWWLQAKRGKKLKKITEAKKYDYYKWFK